jgi:hypothetical protein
MKLESVTIIVGHLVLMISTIGKDSLALRKTKK